MRKDGHVFPICGPPCLFSVKKRTTWHGLSKRRYDRRYVKIKCHSKSPVIAFTEHLFTDRKEICVTWISLGKIFTKNMNLFKETRKQQITWKMCRHHDIKLIFLSFKRSRLVTWSGCCCCDSRLVSPWPNISPPCVGHHRRRLSPRDLRDLRDLPKRPSWPTLPTTQNALEACQACGPLGVRLRYARDMSENGSAQADQWNSVR